MKTEENEACKFLLPQIITNQTIRNFPGDDLNQLLERCPDIRLKKCKYWREEKWTEEAVPEFTSGWYERMELLINSCIRVMDSIWVNLRGKSNAVRSQKIRHAISKFKI